MSGRGLPTHFHKHKVAAGEPPPRPCNAKMRNLEFNVSCFIAHAELRAHALRLGRASCACKFVKPGSRASARMLWSDPDRAQACGCSQALAPERAAYVLIFTKRASLDNLHEALMNIAARGTHVRAQARGCSFSQSAAHFHMYALVHECNSRISQERVCRPDRAQRHACAMQNQESTTPRACSRFHALRRTRIERARASRLALDFSSPRPNAFCLKDKRRGTQAGSMQSQHLECFLSRSG